jgi:hypothetical protein
MSSYTLKNNFRRLVVGSLVGSLVIAMTGCSMFGADKSAKQIAEAEREAQIASANFTKKNGKVTLTFDTDGQWESITSFAIAAVPFNSAEGQEQAVTIATLRAKRNIVEFLNTDINTSRSVVVLSRTLQKANEQAAAQQTTSSQNQPVALTDDEMAQIDSGNATSGNSAGSQSRRADNNFVVANTIREQISSSASAILKGVGVVNQEFSPDFKTVKVEVRGERRFIRAVNTIRMDMIRSDMMR